MTRYGGMAAAATFLDPNARVDRIASFVALALGAAGFVIGLIFFA